jgi:diaminopimelate decarboxylase
MAAGFPPERILYTGTSISRDDLERVFGINGLTVNIDAPEQLEIMARVRRRAFPGKRIRVSVRWNPGIGRGFNPRVVTAGARSSDGTPIKFGVEERKVAAVFERARALGFVPVGLHQHLGSGWVRQDFPIVREAVVRIVRKARELKDLGFPLEFLDFGGGFGPRYTREQGLFPVERYLRLIARSVAEARLGLKAIAVEPGKFLVGDAGALLVSVEYVKESYGNLFACVNGGTYNTVPRPAIYIQAYHEIINASRVRGTPTARLTVAGHLCETGDVFGKERLMPVPKTGQVLAVLVAGAYCRSMASTFNLRNIPPEILI